MRELRSAYEADHDEYVVRLLICSSTLTPEEIERQTGIHASDVWRRGEQFGRGPSKRRDYGWVLDSGVARERAPEEHCLAIARHTRGKSAAFRAIAQEPGTTITTSIAVYTPFGNNVVSLSPATIAALEDVGSGLEVDLYDLRDDDGSTEFMGWS